MNIVQIYRGRGYTQPWRWRVVAPNGRIISSSGEGYFSRWNAKRAAKKLFPDLPIRKVGQ